MHGRLAEILYGFVHTVKFVEWANVLEQFLKRFSSVTDLCCQLQHPVHNQVKHLQNHILKGTYIKEYQRVHQRYQRVHQRAHQRIPKNTSKVIKEYIKRYHRVGLGNISILPPPCNSIRTYNINIANISTFQKYSNVILWK